MTYCASCCVRVPWLIGWSPTTRKVFCVPLSIAPPSQSIGPAEHAHERDGERVIGRDALAPHVALVPEHGLAREQIGVGALQAGRLGDAVQIDDQVPLRRFARQTLLKAQHRLVVAIHEVDT